MKKTIAILVACIMLIACVPLTAYADETVTGVVSWDTEQTIQQNETLTVNGTLTVSVTLKNQGTIVINEGGSITFAGAGRLVNEGTVTVRNGGKITFGGTGKEETGATLYNAKSGMISFGTSATGTVDKGSEGYNYGEITNSGALTVNGKLLHNVTIPGSFSESYEYYETWNRQPTTVYFDVYYYMYQQGDTDDAYSKVENFKKYPCESETNVPVPHGEKLFVMIVPRIGADGTGEWVDSSRLQLNAGTNTLDVTTILDTESENAVRTPEYGAVFTITPSNAMKVDIKSTNYKDIVKIFEVVLPRTEGYYVITDNNDVDRVDVEFGKTLSFRVVLAEEYDKSEPYVYVNSIYMEPADYGYFRITGPMESDGFANNGGVQDDLVITVMGVSANERQEQMASLVTFIQEIFSIIEEIFSYFLSIFEGLGSLGA